MPRGALPKESTAERKAKFLEHLKDKLEVASASRSSGIPTRTVNDWKRRDPEFATAVEDARFHAISELVESVYERALNKDKKYDERTAALLSMFLVKGHFPQYRESYKADIEIKEVKFTFNIPKPEGLALPAHRAQLIEGEVVSESQPDE